MQKSVSLTTLLVYQILKESEKSLEKPLFEFSRKKVTNWRCDLGTIFLLNSKGFAYAAEDIPKKQQVI